MNNISSKYVVSTPYKIWTGHKPSILYLQVWDCLAYVKHLDSDKLGPNSDWCLFIRYHKETKGYFFYLEDEQKVFVALKATFLEKKFLGEEK